MKILIDTNIILDILMKREPFFESSAKILKLSENNIIDAFISANSVTDIYYILKKYMPDKAVLKGTVIKLLSILNIAGITKKHISHAFELDFNDFEDALQSACAKSLNADYIVSRNINDFKNSSIPAITPDVFLTSL